MSKTGGQRWRKALLGTDATLQQAIRNLEETGFQVVLVVNSDGILQGTLTDGDIRRGLLAGLQLTSSIASIVYREPLVAPPELGRETALQLMRANRLHQIPILDKERRVVGLHLWDELMAPVVRSNVMVIMAGGKGTRLQPHTNNCPKPLLPVGGKPMLEHIIERARAEGFSTFILTVHYLGHMIEEYFGNGERWNVRIDYIHEEAPLGTAGALSLLNPRPSDPFIVSNGDVLTDIKYGELLDFHRKHQAAATMAVRLHEWQHPYGVVQTTGVNIVGFEEKPVSRTYINAGVYALNPQAIDALQSGEASDMPTLFDRLRDQGQRTIVYPMHEPWLDVGRADDWTRAQRS